MPDTVTLGIILEFWEEDSGTVYSMIDEGRLSECGVSFNPEGILGVNPISEQRNYLSSAATGVPVSSAVAVNVTAAPVVCNHTAYAASQARLLDLLERPLSAPASAGGDRLQFDDYDAINRVSWQVASLTSERAMAQCRAKFEGMLTSTTEDITRRTKRCGKPRLVPGNASEPEGDGDRRRLALGATVDESYPEGRKVSRFAASARAQMMGAATRLVTDTRAHAASPGALTFRERLNRVRATAYARGALVPVAAELAHAPVGAGARRMEEEPSGTEAGMTARQGER